MTVKEKYIYIDDETLLAYIRSTKKKLDGKEFEFATALLLKVFLERLNNVKCYVGVHLNPKFLKLYSDRSKPLDSSEVRILIEKHTVEYDPADICISPINTRSKTGIAGWLFQIKRFGYFQKGNNGTDGFLDF